MFQNLIIYTGVNISFNSWTKFLPHNRQPSKAFKFNHQHWKENEKKNFFLFIGCKSTMWPAKNYLLIMVFSWAMSSNCIWLHIIFCSCINETTLFSFLQLLLREKRHIASLMEIFIKKLIWWLNGKTILLLNSVIAKYRDLSVCRISIIHSSFGLHPFCSPHLTNHDILSNLIHELLKATTPLRPSHLVL